MPRRKRLIDRIGDGSVLVFPALGAMGLVIETAEYGRPTSAAWELLAIFACIASALHIWFRAEDRWRARRLLSEARRRRLRARQESSEG